MSKHNHKESKKAWRDYWGDSPQGQRNAVNFSAIGKADTAYHGYCEYTGTHIITAFCSCGAVRYSGSKCPNKWIGSEDEND